jgi:hypothetical protein
MLAVEFNGSDGGGEFARENPALVVRSGYRPRLERPVQTIDFIGAGCMSRTCDLLITNKHFCLLLAPLATC